MSDDGAWTLINNIGDTLRSRGFGPGIGPVDERVIAMAKALDEHKAKLAFLREKGIAVGMMQAGGKPPVLAYAVVPHSELCDLRTLQKLNDALARVAELEAERTRALASVDGVDLREGHIVDNADPDQLRSMLHGAGLAIARLKKG